MRDLSQWISSLHLPGKKDLVINVEALRIIGAGEYSPMVSSEEDNGYWPLPHLQTWEAMSLLLTAIGMPCF